MRDQRQNSLTRLEHSDRLQHLLFDESPACIVIMQCDGILIDINRSFQDKLGYPKKDLLNHNLLEFVTPESMESTRKNLKQIAQDGCLRELKIKFKKCDLKTVSILFSKLERFYDDSNESSFIIGTGFDVTVLSAFGKQNFAEDEWIQTFLNHLEDMVYFQDLHGNITHYNNAHLKISEYSDEEFNVTQNLWLKIVEPEDLRKNQAFFQNYPEGTASHEAEFRIKSKSGEWRWIQSRMLGIKDSSDKFIGYACVDRDITNMKRFENVLRELISVRESIFDSANVLLVVLNEENDVIMWNTGAHEITGYSREKAIGNPHIWEYLYPEKAYRECIFRELFEINPAKKAVSGFESTIQTKTGDRRIISWYARNIFDENGISKGLIGLGCDITKRKQAEKQLKILQKNLQLEKQKLEQVLDISNQISSILELNQLIDFIPDVVTKLLSSNRCSLMLLDVNKQELWIVGSKGLDVDIVKESRVKFGDPIAGLVAKTGNPLLVEDLEKVPFIGKTNRPSYRSRSFISVPVKLHDNIVGVVNVAEKNDNSIFTKIDLKILEMIVKQAAISIENAYYYREMERLSNTDPVTTLFNHRYFIQRLDEEINRVKRNHQPLTLMMIDLDNFKGYNDSFGHLEGDRLLSEIGRVINDAVRSIDIACRYAGDEFVVILPNTDISQAATVATRIRESVESLDLSGPVTVSIGLAQNEESDNSRKIISKTDRALYRSKEKGKNTISMM